jgi:3-oxoacyl-[acyl-carrier protein] reductase
MPDTDSSPQTALVTGGSRGIGCAIVEHLVRAGLRVTFTYLSNAEAAMDLEVKLRGEGGIVEGVRLDARDANASKDLANRLIDREGRIDVLVNNAGVARDRLLALMPLADWSEVLDTSLNGLFGTTQPVAKQMMRQRAGRIVNLTSVSGMVGIAGQTNYSAAKAAIIGFTRSLSRELAPAGVSVNAVAPGFVDTDMLSGFSAEGRAQAMASVPMKRFATVDEIAELVRYLALSAPSYLTGQTIVIDGGLFA